MAVPRRLYCSSLALLTSLLSFFVVHLLTAMGGEDNNPGAKKGRLACIRLSKGALTDALWPHIYGRLDMLVGYSQLHFRRGPVWNELFSVRDVCQDLFTASNGYCLTQKFLESELEIVQLKRTKQTCLSAEDKEHIIDLCYRLRAAMRHARSARVHSWRPPVRFGVLSALIAMCQTAAPPDDKQEQESPIKDKTRRLREQVWLFPPGLFHASTAPHDDDTEDCVEVVEPPLPPVDCIDLLDASSVASSEFLAL